jgi:hypothetical protein
MSGELAESSLRDVLIAKQSAPRVIAPQNSSDAHYTVRNSMGIQRTKNTFQSAAKRKSFQVKTVSHGQKRVAGSIVTDLYAGALEDEWAAVVRRTPTAINAISAGSGTGWTISVDSGTGVCTVTAASGTPFSTLKRGVVGRFTGLAATADNGRNAYVKSVTGGGSAFTCYMADGDPLTAVGTPDTSVTFTIPGKRNFIPLASHTNDLFTIEDRLNEPGFSRLFRDASINSVQLNVQQDAQAVCDWGWIGTGYQKLAKDSEFPWFTSPLTPPDLDGFSSVSGFLEYNGLLIPIATSFQVGINKGMTPGSAVFSDIAPKVFHGDQAVVTGQFTAYLQDETWLEAFEDEVEGSVDCMFELPGTTNREFFSITLPRVKINGSDIDDPSGGLQVTIPFQSLEPEPASGTDASSFIYQDSEI